jgi:hypothetical protein
MKKVTFSRVANGEFAVLVNGVASKYTITNGSAGISGNGRNEYLIANAGQIKQSGLTLAKAKKMVAYWISKEVVVEEDFDLSGWIPEDPEVTKARDDVLLAAYKAKQGK